MPLNAHFDAVNTHLNNAKSSILCHIDDYKNRENVQPLVLKYRREYLEKGYLLLNKVAVLMKKERLLSKKK